MAQRTETPTQAKRRRPRVTSATQRAVQRRKFVAAYVAGGAGVAGRAGPAALVAGIGRTKGSAAVRGHEMLKDPAVKAMIERRLQAIDARAERITEELGRVAFSDIRDIAEWDADGVRVFASDALDDVTAAAIHEVEQRDHKDGREVRVKMHDKLAALRLLARIRKMLRVEITGRDGGPVEHAVQFYLPRNGREIIRCEGVAGEGGEGTQLTPAPGGDRPGDRPRWKTARP